MNFTFLVVTLLFIAGAAQAGRSQNAAQLSSPQGNQVDVVLATPAPTTFEDIPTPAPTNFTGLPMTNEDESQLELASESTDGLAYSSTGAVGVAYSTTRAEYEAEAKNTGSDSSSSYTVPIIVIGCLVGVLGTLAAVVVMRKRKAVAEEVETDYSDAIHTPVA